MAPSGRRVDRLAPVQRERTRALDRIERSCARSVASGDPRAQDGAAINGSTPNAIGESDNQMIRLFDAGSLACLGAARDACSEILSDCALDGLGVCPASNLSKQGGFE